MDTRSTSFPAVAGEIEETVAAILPALAALGEEGSLAVRPGGTWTHREILGHLIDSAVNNHQRFVRSPLTEPLVLPGYAQDDWVARQAYVQRPWKDLLLLWQVLNVHIAHVVRLIPGEAAGRECRIGDGPPVTLGFLAEDYVSHLRHHLDQIVPAGGAPGQLRT